MRNAIVAYAKEHGLIKRGNRYYKVVALSRPTKFLGWYVMNGDRVLSPRFKTKAEAQDFFDGWALFGWKEGTEEVRRRFKSTTKQHFEVWRIPSYLRRKGWEY